MLKRIETETTITVTLSNQEIIDIIKNLNIIPPDWDLFSIEVKGHGISCGANIVLKQTTSKVNPDNL